MNFIQTQNPWLGAVEAVQSGLNPLAKMYMELPQVRAQMQQHADQMGIQQGRLNLDQQELQAKAPVYNAQASNYNAEAGLHKQQADQLAALIDYAAKAYTAQTNAGMNPAIAALTGSAGLNSGASERLVSGMIKPMVLGQNQTGFSNPAMGEVQPLAHGVMNIPAANSAYPGGVGMNVAAPVQTGIVRSPATGRTPQDQIAIYAAQALMNGSTLGQVTKGLGMTNLLSQPVTGPMSAPMPQGQQIQIPPPAMRGTNQVYNTPKGPLKWTGTGWVQP